MTVYNSPFGQVVGGDLNRYLVPGRDLDKVFPHLAGNVREQFVPVFETNCVHRRREHFQHYAGHFN